MDANVSGNAALAGNKAGVMFVAGQLRSDTAFVL
jgi:hypothetical protein